MLVGFGLTLQACIGSRYLQENEYLLARQSIRSDRQVKQKTLKSYYQQRINRTWLGLSVWRWMYEIGERNFDTTKIKTQVSHIKKRYDHKLAALDNNSPKYQHLQQRRDRRIQAKQRILQTGNLLMRWGEPPVIYNPYQRDLTSQNLLAYLQTKGYFDAQISSIVKFRHKSAYVTYQIQENQPYLIKKIRLNTPDTAIQKLLEPYQQQSLVQPEGNYDQDILILERERIQELLINQGYFNFNKQYISFDVDTTGGNQNVVIETVIALPAASEAHRTYYIDSVIVTADLHQPGQQPENITTYHGITFKIPHQAFNPSLLETKIPLNPPQLYKSQDIKEVQRILNNLNMFKYVNLTHDTTDTGNLITHIHTSPSSKFQLKNELGIKAEKTLTSPKPFYNLSLESRNWFNRLEIFRLEMALYTEEVALYTNKTPWYNNQTYKVNLSLDLPEFLLPLRSKTHKNLATYQPVTRPTMGYAFSNYQDYKKSKLQISLSYDWKSRGNFAYELTPFRIELINSQLSESLKNALVAKKKQGNNLYRTYEPAFLSNLSFKTTLRNNLASHTDQSSSYLEMFLEVGGILPGLLDAYNLISKRLAYYRYWKIDLSYSQSIPIQPGTALAYQVASGIAYPYDQYKVLPLEKYYFAGGSSNIRAWSPRSLGPGSYKACAVNTIQQVQEQFGELSLRGNIELRQQLTSLLESTLFVDLGNVWMIHATDLTGGDFKFNRFYKEIAIGPGIGLRLKLPFLVLRLDIGLKLYDPSQPLGARLFPPGTWKELINFNIGLGYPF